MNTWRLSKVFSVCKAPLFSARGHMAKPAAAITGQLTGIHSAAGMICPGWFRSLPRACSGGVCAPVEGAASVCLDSAGPWAQTGLCDLGPLAVIALVSFLYKIWMNTRFTSTYPSRLQVSVSVRLRCQHWHVRVGRELNTPKSRAK